MGNIVNLSEAATIAVHSIVMIARSKSPLNVPSLVQNTSSSKHHVSKVLQRLVKAGFITSNRGPYGGFVLSVNPEEVTLLDIYESIEGKIKIPECPAYHDVCPFEHCIIDHVTQNMTTVFQDYLKSKTLASYLEEK